MKIILYKKQKQLLKIAFGVSGGNATFLLQGLACTDLEMTFGGTSVTIHSHTAGLMPAAKPTGHAAHPERPARPVVARDPLQGHRNPAQPEPRPPSGF